MIRPAFLLLLLALAAFWPALTRNEWRHTEARRVQIAQEMKATGDWLVPRLGGESTLAKPPLQYWVLAAFSSLGEGRFWLRLPSLLALWGLALVCFSVLDGMCGRRAAWIGAVGVLLSPVVLPAPSAEIDPLFAALTGISIIWLGQGVSFERRNRLLLGGLVGGLALLVKGPPYFLFLAGTVLIWARRRRLRGLAWFGLPCLAVPLLGYYLPLLLARGIGLEDLFATAEKESVSRFVSSFSQLGGVPGYLMAAAASLLPLGFWTFYEHRGQAPRSVEVKREELLLRMTVGAALGGIIFLAMFRNRATRYFLPAIPLFIFSVAPAVAAYVGEKARPGPMARHSIKVLALASSLGLLLIPWLPRPLPAISSVLLLFLALGPAWISTRRDLVLYLLLGPLLAAWTVLPFIEDYQSEMRRNAAGGQVLRGEMERLDVQDVETLGPFLADVILELGRIPTGDEMAAKTPTRGWLLLEDPDRRPAISTPDYRDRVRVRLRHKSLVLRQRVPR